MVRRPHRSPYDLNNILRQQLMVEYMFLQIKVAHDNCTRYSLQFPLPFLSGTKTNHPDYVLSKLRAGCIGHGFIFMDSLVYSLLAQRAILRPEICQPIALPRFVQPMYLSRIFLDAPR